MQKQTFKHKVKAILNGLLAVGFVLLVGLLIFGLVSLQWVAHFQKFPGASWWTFFFK